MAIWCYGQIIQILIKMVLFFYLFFIYKIQWPAEIGARGGKKEWDG